MNKSPTVADNDTDALADGIDGDLKGEVVCHHDDWLQLLGVALGIANEQSDIVPFPIGEFFRVTVFRKTLVSQNRKQSMCDACAQDASE
jgi:hypothetical protein